MGADLQSPDAGCCGMAGPFGFARDKFEVSQAVGERVLLPAVRQARPETLIVADGFSCQEQIRQATGRRAMHLARPGGRGTEPGTAGRARQAGRARESHAAAPDHRGGAAARGARPHDRRSRRRGQEFQGHLFVFTGAATRVRREGATASQLFEFDQNLKFVKQWGQDNYAASFAHTVRVDKHDNVWMTDEGANMIVKFNPQGQVSMVLGRKTGSHRLSRALHRTRREERGPCSCRRGGHLQPADRRDLG